MGAVDMSLSGQDQIAKHLPFHDAISTPFAFPSYEVADKVIDGPFKEWSDPELTKKGLVHLSDREWGFRQLTNSRKPVLTPARDKVKARAGADNFTKFMGMVEAVQK